MLLNSQGDCRVVAKQSGDCWVRTCSCTSRTVSRCTSRCTSRLSTAGLAGIQKRLQTVGRLSGQNLLVYFESYLEVHVKVYVKVVYSRYCWNPKGRKQSRNCLLHLCSNFLTVRQTFPDFYLKYDFSLDRKLINHPL